MNEKIDKKMMITALAAQQKEINEYYIYTGLAKLCRDLHNAEVLRAVGEEEKEHARYWQGITGKEVKPSGFKVFRSIIKAENDPRALKSALYTGMAYIITVALLIMPFLLLPDKFIALAITLCITILIILAFNYYLATARDLDFKQRFTEMIIISMGVASLSFGVGFILNRTLGI